MKQNRVVKLRPLDGTIKARSLDRAQERTSSGFGIKETTVSQTSNTLDYASHPKYKLIQDWIGESEENKQWFEENKSTLFADPESITIAGFALALQPLSGLYTHADGLQQLSKTSHPKYPDWRNIIGTLPGDGANKSKFIMQVLNLPLGGYRLPDGSQYDQGYIGYAWSSVSVGSIYENLGFFSFYIDILDDDPAFGHGLLGCK